LVEELLSTLLKPTEGSSDKTEDFQTSWQRIAEHFDLLFTTEQSIDQLKQTILQLAVMGKLAPQNPSDEPAIILLEKIAEEKAQLIADKKIKKQKALPTITNEEKPFELPSEWEWSRIIDASLFTEYGTSEKAFEGTDGVPVLKMGDIQSGKVLHGGQKVVPSTIDDLPNLYLDYGDVLYNRTNSAALVGKTGMFEGDSGCYTFASYLIRIRCHFQCVTPQYLTLSMNTPLFRRTQIDPYVKQQCGQANVNGTLMKSMIISLPPLAEQHRIVEKVEELMAWCEQLKARLSDAQTTQLHLTEVLVSTR
jgi:type I restriction enzyme S subunit